MSARTREEIVTAVAQRELRAIEREEADGRDFTTFDEAADWITDRDESDPDDPLALDRTLMPAVALKLALLLVEREERLTHAERLRLHLPRRSNARARFARYLAEKEHKRYLRDGSGAPQHWIAQRAAGHLRPLDPGTLSQVQKEMTGLHAGYLLDLMLEREGLPEEEPPGDSPQLRLIRRRDDSDPQS